METFFNQVENYISLYGLSILGAILTVVIGLWIAKALTNRSAKMVKKRGYDETLASFVSKLVKVILYLVVIIAALDQIGVDTTSVIAVLGAAGIAVGFALQGTLSNFAAGVMIIIFRQIKVNDFVEGGGTMGTVAEIGMFHTKLDTPDNKAIYVPNSKLVGDNITNFSEHDIRRVDMVVGISYQDDIDKAKSIINELLEKDERVLEDPAPTVVVGALADSSVNFNVRPWTKKENYWTFYWDMTETIKKKFDEEGISIPFPQRDVHLFQN